MSGCILHFDRITIALAVVVTLGGCTTSKPAAEPSLSPESNAHVEEILRRRHALNQEYIAIEGDPEAVKQLFERKRQQPDLLWSMSPSDLALITLDDRGLASDALSILERSPFREQLSKDDLQVLSRHLRNPKDERVARSVAKIMATRTHSGLDMLAEIMRDERQILVGRVLAAGALTETQSYRREASQLLLEVLADEGRAGEIAAEDVGELEPWMAEYLILRLSQPTTTSPLKKRALGQLHGNLAVYDRVKPSNLRDVIDEDNHANSIRLKEAARGVFLAALDDPDSAVRVQAVVGLGRLGPRRDDLPLYERIATDSDTKVRAALYGQLAAMPLDQDWGTEILMSGLRDDDDGIRELAANDLGARHYRPAVPVLIEILRTPRPDRLGQVDDLHLSAATAVVEIAGLRGYDFRVGTACHDYGDGMRVRRIERDDDAFRRGFKRLLAWWDRSGRRRSWAAQR